MKKRVLFLMFATLLVFGLFGCQQTGEEPKLPETDEVNGQAEVMDDDFVYRLVTKKSHYNEGEPVKIYAELEYRGPKNMVVIEHGSSPFLFPMTETERDYEIDNAVNLMGKKTTLKKGVPLREESWGGGGYSEHDKEAYKKFMKQVMAQKYPSGHYIVNGFANFILADNQKEYKVKASIEFYVD